MNEHGIKQHLVLFAALLKHAWLYYHNNTLLGNTSPVRRIYMCSSHRTITTITATGTSAGTAAATTATTTARTTAKTTALKTATTAKTSIANYTSWKHVARKPYIHMMVSQVESVTAHNRRPHPPKMVPGTPPKNGPRNPPYTTASNSRSEPA